MAISRHACREIALQTLFAWLFWSQQMDTKRNVKDVLEQLLQVYFQYVDEDVSFAENIVVGVEKHFEEIVKQIEAYTPQWDFANTAMVDQAILCVGVYELLFNKDVPDVVAINEAIELGKKFGNETSSKFVNGVLNSIMKAKK